MLKLKVFDSTTSRRKPVILLCLGLGVLVVAAGIYYVIVQRGGFTGIFDRTASAHGLRRNCELCHGKQDEKPAGSEKVTLIAELPQLCFECHPDTDYSDSKDVVHGPLAISECIFCHDPHSSKHEHLLKKPVPDLCYQCHKKDAVDAIPNHLGMSACLICHTGHTSPNKGLLRGGSE